MLQLRCVVLEDEDDNRNWLLKTLRRYPELEVVGDAATIDDAFRLIALTKPDAAFMDIKLIGGDAFTLLSRLQANGLPIPYIVMTTGFPEYVMTALNDYRRFVVQYLVKPFLEDWQGKFRKAIDALMAAKMNDAMALAAPATASTENAPRHTFLQNRGNLLRLDFDKIAYLEAAGSGEAIVVTDTEQHQVDMTLNRFLEILPSEEFLRISKNNVVNTRRILKINREDRMVEIRCQPKNKTLGVGDTYYTELMKHLPLAKDHAAKKSASPSHPAVSPPEPPVLLNREIASKIQGLQEEKSELFIEKQKSDNLLRNILPESVAEELKQTGQTTARKYDLVSILFCDIKDFTRIAAFLPPEELIQEIDHCFRHFDDIALRHRIEKIKTIGDCYMAAGGLPEPDEDNPVRVVRAAIEIQSWLAQYNTLRKSDGKPQFEARIGIHTGSVVAGVVGQHKFAYDIWGDTVNIAARMEQSGQVGKINISADTYGHVKRYFACRYGGTVEAKNKGELDIYWVEENVR